MNLATILLLGAGQAAFLVLLLATKKNKTLPDGVLAAWVATLGLHHLVYALHHQGVAVPPTALNLNAGVPLLQGPFLFLYVDTLTSGRRLRGLDTLHLLPYAGYAGYVTFLLPNLAAATPSTVSVFRLSGWITAAILLSVPVYSVVALRRLSRHGRATRDRHSDSRGRDLAWLRRIVLALVAVWAVVIAAVVVTRLLPGALPAGASHQITTAVTLFIYAIGYFGWRQFAVAEPGRRDAPEEAPGKPRGASAKYERSGLERREIDALVRRLEDHLEHDRPHLEPGVTLMKIAANLHTTPNHLSQAINQGLGKNFHELINKRRVEAFKERALDPRNRHRTLLAVAFDSGFSSKSSFNRVFKKMTGMSPRQFVERSDRT